jgi:hypothetical protein
VTDISSALPPPEEGGVTIPIEGVRRRVRGTSSRFTGQLLPTERTAGLMVLAALFGMYLLRVVFRGALGD